MLARDRYHFRGQVASERVLPSVMMELCRELQTEGEAERVGQLPCHAERSLRFSKSLIGIAQEPQGPGSETQAGHPGVISIKEDMGLALLDVVERGALLEVRTRCRKLSEPEQSVSHDIVGDQKRTGILHLFSQGEELLS